MEGGRREGGGGGREGRREGGREGVEGGKEGGRESPVSLFKEQTIGFRKTFKLAKALVAMLLLTNFMLKALSSTRSTALRSRKGMTHRGESPFDLEYVRFLSVRQKCLKGNTNYSHLHFLATSHSLF